MVGMLNFYKYTGSGEHAGFDCGVGRTPTRSINSYFIRFHRRQTADLKKKATDLRQMPGEERALWQEKMSGLEFIDKQILFCRPVEFYFIS